MIDLVAERKARRPAPITGQDFLANSYRVEDCKTGPALAEWNRLPQADRQAIWRIIERDGFIDLENMWACTFLKNRMWEPLISEPSKWRAQFDRELAQLGTDRVFVEEDTPQWDAWSRHYREHGGPNGLRVGPSAFGYDGKQGNFFADEWPPRATVVRR